MTAPSVLLVGRFDDDAHAHANQRARALERLGCDVTPFDLARRPGLLGRLAGADLEKRLTRASRESEAELVVVLGGRDLDEATVVLLRSATGVPWIRCSNGADTAGDLVAAAPAYDRIFVAGTDLLARLDAKTREKAEVLPHAADPSVYRPLNSKDQYRANVVFAGSATPAREAYLTGLVEFGLALWGPGWRRTSLRDYCRGEARNTAEYVRAYGGASVAVNLHRDIAGGDGASSRATCNERVFELAAMGVPQIVDERTDLGRWFEVGTHVAAFRTADELRRGVERLLHDPPTAEAMASGARAHALALHTYMHRMRRVLEAVGIAPAPRTPAAAGR